MIPILTFKPVLIVKRPLSIRQWKKQNHFSEKINPAPQQGCFFHAAARWNSIGVMHFNLSW